MLDEYAGMMENLPGLKEFFTNQFTMLDIIEVFSSLNQDGLIQATVYHRKNGVKHRLDFVMVGHFVGDGPSTEAYNQKHYREILDRINAI